MAQIPTILESEVAATLNQSFGHAPLGSEFQAELSNDFLLSLEHYIPYLLSQDYSEIEVGLLDGFYITSARKVGPRSAELYGWAILMNEPGVTPFFLRITLNPSDDSVDSYDLLFGEPGYGRLGIARTLGSAHLIETRPAPIQQIQWKYRSSRNSVDFT